MSQSNGEEFGELVGTLNLACAELKQLNKDALSEEFKIRMLKIVLEIGIKNPDELHFEIEILRKEVIAIWMEIR